VGRLSAQILGHTSTPAASRNANLLSVCSHFGISSRYENGVYGLGVFFGVRFEPPSSLLPALHMSDPTGLAIVKAARASLRLVSCSSDQLTLSQLLAMESELRNTLAIVKGHIHAEFTGTSSKNVLKAYATHSYFTDDSRVLIDLTDWASSDEEEAKVGGKNATRTADSEWLTLPVIVASPSCELQVTRVKPSSVRWEFFPTRRCKY
jgi:hypothetical protein